ncbi:MAG: SDR family oxidoreductase [Pseudomonadota bacterium]
MTSKPTVFVTGAAGLLGGELTGQLMARGYDVIGLVNRNPEICRNDHSVVAGVETIKGDITAPRFGLDEAAWASLAGQVGLIVHCAAITDFAADWALHQAVNIDGTRHVIELAEAADAGLVHVSTAYVCGDREGAILESELEAGQGFTNGYEKSKNEAERLVRDCSVPFAIARPSIVLGDHSEGRTRSFDTIYPIIKVLTEGRVTTMPALPSATLDIVPIDYVCEGIVLMVERFDEARGQTYHLIGSSPMPLDAFARTAPKFDGLHHPSFVDPSDFDLGALPSSERRFFQRGAEIYARYFMRNPRFDDSGFRAFAGTEPPLTEDLWWERLVTYAMDVGFIKPRKKKSVA